MIILSYITFYIGIFFFIVSTVGVVRLPDLYSRLHAATICDTLGLGFVTLSLAMRYGISIESLKLLFIVALIWIANPVAAHLISKVAYNNKLPTAQGKFIFDEGEK
ncbi:multicomponent Na+:H+ antiporter subunit G [Caldanaerovirga acetigignens]|uniref:Multicomponent Na+:H+ antiporter subunit G n=2 Tax=Caldanaerovirga acetigignens TaxID=447595 RepID=A0A1M7JJI0_9FIRM|nr:multicomponent Na+:H+ antiporter subunit G [Caldanaerovirga acetigignens]